MWSSDRPFGHVPDHPIPNGDTRCVQHRVSPLVTAKKAVRSHHVVVWCVGAVPVVDSFCLRRVIC